MALELSPAERSSQSRVHSATPCSPLEDFACRYYTPLLNFFRKRASNPAEVPDLVQQVFLRLAQYHKIGQIQNPEGFIFQTAANVLTDHFRRLAVRAPHACSAEADDAATSSYLTPERVLLGEEALERLVHALKNLPNRTRDVFVLRCFDGLRSAEVAQRMGISVRAVEKHVVKAMAYIAEHADLSGAGSLE
jgi:RNA polymerase sigma-70 factor (ECF subfamily)